MQIDIEAPRGSGLLTLNKEPDKFGEKSINVDFSIINETGDLFTKARDLVKKYLDNNNVKYSELPFSTSAEKYEDVYHPFGMFCDFKDVNDYLCGKKIPQFQKKQTIETETPKPKIGKRFRR